MYISKSRFINWTRCPMYFPMELKHNPTGKDDIDAERERREEILKELADGMNESTMESAESTEEDDEIVVPNIIKKKLTRGHREALLPYYNQVENEALRVAKKYFHGIFQSQKLFEYELHGNTYRCYVDIYNENENEINIIEVKATTNRKYIAKPDKDGKLDGLMFSDVPPNKRGGKKYSLFVKEGNIWRLNFSESKVETGKCVFAWQVLAGVAYDINENWTVEAGYRLFGTSKVKAGKNVKIKTPLQNSLELGLRYNF